MVTGGKGEGPRRSLKDLIPSRRQWNRWSLPSKHTTISLAVGIVALLLAIVFYLFPKGQMPAEPDTRVWFSAWESKADFELERGGRTLLFVWVPTMSEPADRLVVAAAKLRPVNYGNRSLKNLQVVTIGNRLLWPPGFADLEKAAAIPISGSQGYEIVVQQLGTDCIATRTVPRLDPLGGAPCPLFFVVEASSAGKDGNDVYRIQGELEVRVLAEDWEGVQHVLDIHSISAPSEEEFVESSREIARTLRGEGYPNVPVVMALTKGKGIIEGDEDIVYIQAGLEVFLSRGKGKLSDF